MSTATRDVVDGIVTPEAVVLELETAGVASRVLAGLIDVGVQFVALWIGMFVVALVAAAAGGDVDSFMQTGVAILLTLLIVVYPVATETLWRGRTIGKRALGLRAVTAEGTPITFRHATLRMMGGLVDRLIPPGGVTGALFVLGTRRRQRVGDLLAGTVVVRDPERAALPTAFWFPIPPGLEAYAATIDPSRMTTEQYTLLRAFLLRVRQVAPGAWADVARQLADRTAAVLGHDRPTGVHPEAFLLCAVARYQRRNSAGYRAAPVR